MTAQALTPQSLLRLHLAGQWLAIDPAQPQAAADAMASWLPPGTDGAAKEASALALAAAVASMASSAKAAEISQLAVCRTLAPGLPFPALIAVTEPARLEIPGAATDQRRALRQLREHLPSPERDKDWVVVTCRDGLAIRSWSLVTMPVAQASAIELVQVQLWRTLPGSDRIVGVQLLSPLTSIPLTVVHLADSIVMTARGSDDARAKAPQEASAP